MYSLCVLGGAYLRGQGGVGLSQALVGDLYGGAAFRDCYAPLYQQTVEGMKSYHQALADGRPEDEDERLRLKAEQAL